MTPHSKKVALTIAGSDPSGGAGVQADLKTFHQFGVYGEAVITLLTVQNTLRVDQVEYVAPQLILRQLEAVLEDIPPDAAKTGALGGEAAVRAVAEVARRFQFPLVVDPVMISKHGAPLMDAGARAALSEVLLPLARLVTPNLHEAGAIAGFPVQSIEDMIRAARAIQQMGPRAVLIKGGHLRAKATDVLIDDAGLLHIYPEDRIDTPHTHGTGCAYSAAITACLACGYPLPQAVLRAKQYVTAAIRGNPGLGHGCGPIDHHAPI